MCLFVLMAIVLATAVVVAAASGLPRTKPHIFVPLLVAFIAWGSTVIFQVWFEFTFDPRSDFDIRVDWLLITIGLFLITALCAAWSIASLLIGWRRSRKSQSNKR